jgi:cystathionine beta-lyase family protein involved in aluminum resistance
MIKKILEKCRNRFEYFEKIREINSIKVLDAFRKCRVSEAHFASSTGYGYGDRGREILNSLFTEVFCTESALVSANFVSGTHALCTTFFAIARPGDAILCITGKPYDTLENIISGRDNGSLYDFGIKFEIAEMDNFEFKLKKNVRIVYIQRSKGYTLKKMPSVSEINVLVNKIKEVSSEVFIILDNCYGEFTEIEEPHADLIVGSLIKNPGGGIAPCGAYIAGKKSLVDLCFQRFTAPGLHDMGATHFNREIFMGLFCAPRTVCEALKTATFTAALFAEIGFEVFPKYDEERTDIVQVIKFRNKENLMKFCQTLQRFSPVESFAIPEACVMPGYKDEVIMAAGGFISGSSIELSADAPLREPFSVWLQGGIDFYTAKFAIIKTAEELTGEKYV